jgi:hypothetical protein
MRGLSRLRGHLERVGHPAGMVGLKMSKLAQLLKQIAEDCRVVCHQRRSCHNRGFHQTPFVLRDGAKGIRFYLYLIASA